MRKRGAHHKPTGQGLHRTIAKGIWQMDMDQRIADASAPMRAMFDMLADGEVLTIKGKAVMEMPAGFGTVDLGEWVEIQPALEGWIDCLARIDEKLPNRALTKLSRYLGAGLSLTPGTNSTPICNACGRCCPVRSRARRPPPR